MDYTKNITLLFLLANLQSHDTWSADAFRSLSRAKPNHVEFGKTIIKNQGWLYNKFPHRCNKCNEDYADISRQIKCQQSHNNPYTHFCGQCHTPFKSKKDLRDHANEHLNNNYRYCCGKCEAVFRTKNDLELHGNAHLFATQWKALLASENSIRLLKCPQEVMSGR